MASVVQEMDDITRCCVCTELFSSPKVLPCLHTFCLVCLEKYVKGAATGENETCPLCRREFVIPEGGIARLPDNYFIEKLVAVRKVSCGQEIMCDLCADGNEEADASRVAKWHCANCGDNLCGICCKAHQKSRLSRAHQVVEIGDQQTVRSRPSFCGQHSDKQVELYCDDCEKVICLKCCLIEHKTHTTHDIDEVADGHRHQLQSKVDDVRETLAKCRQESETTEIEKTKFVDCVSKSRHAITEYKNELVECVELQTIDLLQQLNNIYTKTVKDIETNAEEINRQQVMFESFTRYCQEVIDKATPSDILRFSDDLHARAKELNNVTLSEASIAYPVKFSPSDILDIVTEENLNIVGAIVGPPSDGLEGKTYA